MRIVLDTDVMVAALRSNTGASRQLLTYALTKRFDLLLSVPLMLEYEAVLKRPQHLRTAAATPMTSMRYWMRWLPAGFPLSLTLHGGRNLVTQEMEMK
jgi:hypothetical protein